jgi:hypothetical protein
MANDQTKMILVGDIKNFRLKAEYYESLNLFEAAKYAGNLASNLELALTTMYPDDQRRSSQNTAPSAQSSTPIQAPPVTARKVAWPLIRSQQELSHAAEMQRSGSRVYALQGKKIGEILNSLKVIDDNTLRAVEQHHNTKKPPAKLIGQILVHMGIIDPEVLTRALLIQAGIPMVDLMSINISSDILNRISKEKAIEKKAIPVGVYNKTLYLAVADPTTFSEQQYFSFLTKMAIRPVFAPAHEIEIFVHTKWTSADSDIWIG